MLPTSIKKTSYLKKKISSSKQLILSLNLCNFFFKDILFSIAFFFQTELKAKFRTDKTELDSLKKETDKLRYALLEKDEELVNVKTECTTYCNLLEVGIKTWFKSSHDMGNV